MDGTQHDLPARDDLARVVELFGGEKVIRARVRNALDAHDVIRAGLPSQSLFVLFDSLVVLRWSASIENVVGITVRTWQRKKDAPSKPLSPEQSGRAWQFAEILARASDVFGSQADAERWLEQPAIAFEQRRPIDLLATPAGAELVRDHLTRLEYGVYT